MGTQCWANDSSDLVNSANTARHEDGIIKRSIMFVLARLVPGVFILGSIAIFTRLLSPSAYGLYALLNAMAILIQLSVINWSSQALYRHLASGEADGREATNAATLVGFLGSLVIAGTVGSLSIRWALGYSWSAALGLLATLAGFASLELINIRHAALGQTKAYAASQFFRAFAVLCGGGLAAAYFGSGEAVLLCVGLAWIATALGGGLIGWIANSDLSHFSVKTLLALLAYGLPLSLSALIMQGTGSLIRALLALYRDTSAVGEYAAGFDFVQYTVGSIGLGIFLAGAPAILAAAERPRAEIDAALTRFGTFLALILVPSAVGLAMIAPELGTLLIGPALLPGAAKVIPWTAAAMLLATLRGYYFELSFQLARWTIGAVISAALTLITALVLGMILIPRAGVEGAAQATFGSFVVGILASYALGRFHAVRIPIPLVELAKIAFATAVMALTTLLPSHANPVAGLIVKIVTGATGYSLAILATNPLQLRPLAIRMLVARLERGSPSATPRERDQSSGSGAGLSEEPAGSGADET